MIHALLAVLALAGASWWVVRLRSDVRRLTEWHRCSELQKLDAHRIGRERKGEIGSLNARIRTKDQQAAQRRREHTKEINRLTVELRTLELEHARQQQAHGTAMTAQMTAHARSVAQLEEDLHQAYRERLRALEWSLEAMLESSRGENCVKIRFHHTAEAEMFARDLERATGMHEGHIRVYKCRVCPRSPWTIEKFLHVTSDGQSAETPFLRPRAKTLTTRIDDDTIAALHKRVNGVTS